MRLYKYIPYNPNLTSIASDLRKNMTPSEKKVWGYLKSNFSNMTWNRQKPLGGFIADFYNSDNLLIIEIDGEIHEKMLERDKERDEYFWYKFSIRTIRFTNQEINQNIDIIGMHLRALVPSLTKEG